ncbi:hypothetical protein [Paenibacillus sp. FJAT-26967]|uniref:hypothetical protein n=1 Tax=Paenibacillus sp. FJAT-26967 TaxID=1729690 RepID=UPI0008383E20|nr:hypothetical protein [Paenibacillus sp. FJAT-26967]
MPSLDRFETGPRDPQADDPAQIAECTYDRCRNPIYEGEKNWDFDQEWFCSPSCIARHMGAYKRYAQ